MLCTALSGWSSVQPPKSVLRAAPCPVLTLGDRTDGWIDSGSIHGSDMLQCLDHNLWDNLALVASFHCPRKHMQAMKISNTVVDYARQHKAKLIVLVVQSGFDDGFACARSHFFPHYYRGPLPCFDDGLPIAPTLEPRSRMLVTLVRRSTARHVKGKF
jgi:hypothetical protein